MLMATASPSWMEEEVSLRQWMPAWIPWPNEMLFAILFNSPFTVICPASPPVYGRSESPSLLGTTGLGITKLPSKKNFKTVMQAPETTPWPVGYAGWVGDPSGKACERK